VVGGKKATLVEVGEIVKYSRNHFCVLWWLLMSLWTNWVII